MFIETAGAGSRAAAAHKTVSRRCPDCCLLNHPNYWNTGSWPMENIQIQTFKPSGCCCCCCDSLLAGRCCVDILIDNEEGTEGAGPLAHQPLSPDPATGHQVGGRKEILMRILHNIITQNYALSAAPKLEGSYKSRGHKKS